MSATIGNIPWTANGRVTATYARSQNGVGASILNLAGQDFPLTNTLQFAVGSVTLGTDLSPGTFQVGTTGTNANLMDSIGNTFQAAGPVGTGTVTINSFSTRRENRDRDIQFRPGAERRHRDEGGHGRNVQRDVLMVAVRLQPDCHFNK